MENNSLLIFKAISNFVRDLNESFGTKQRSLQLYARLVSKTTIAHEAPITKHVNAFRTFCKENSEAISTKNKNKLVNNKIIYSDKVYINMGLIFQNSDKHETETIWKHILAITAIIDPSSKAKDLLRDSLKGSGAEQNFLSDIINKVESNVNHDASNPMEAVSSIMSSGVFTDLMGGMSNGLQSGELDIGKLLGAVQGMVTSLGTMSGGAGSPENMPDLGAMVGQMTSMMNNLQKDVPDSSPTLPEDHSTPSELDKVD